MSHAGGSGSHAEGRRRFAVAELLEVPHQHDLAIIVVELFDGDEESCLQLLPNRGGSGGEFTPDELARQIER